jgi:hypothetical protein
MPPMCGAGLHQHNVTGAQSAGIIKKHRTGIRKTQKGVTYERSKSIDWYA